MSHDLHAAQRVFWNAEHALPHIVKNMDYEAPSGGVIQFFNWLKEHTTCEGLRGIEMGCGKGRNTLWIAEQGIAMTGFDFSEVGIEEARRRSDAKRMQSDQLSYSVHDATTPWPFADHTFDFGIDCFASTDIESSEGRAFARDEFCRVIKPGGYLFVYAISAASQFHHSMLLEHPAEERNTYFHPGSKIDKLYDEQELTEFYKDFMTLEFQKITDSKGVFYGKEYTCENFWMVLGNPF